MPGTTPEKRPASTRAPIGEASPAKINLNTLQEMAAKRIVLKWAKLSEHAFAPLKGTCI